MIRKCGILVAMTFVLLPIGGFGGSARQTSVAQTAAPEAPRMQAPAPTPVAALEMAPTAETGAPER